MRTSGGAVWADRFGAAMVLLAYIAFAVAAVFSRREYYDTVAYALPGANLVATGSLNVAQLGSQYGFDRFWLFNAPFMVVGEVPSLWLFGIGRLQVLTPLVVLGLVNVIVFSFLASRMLRLESKAVSVLIALAFLGTRALPTADLYNQKYSVAAFGCLAVAFLPMRSGEKSTVAQSLAAGLLPLIHPTLVPAAGVWLISRLFLRQLTAAGLAVLAGCGVAAIAWYGRWTALTTQFLPHLRYGQFRQGRGFSGLIDAAAGFPANVPTRILAIAVTLIALVVVASAWKSARSGYEGVPPALPAAAAVLVAVALDGLRGFSYAAYYVSGLGLVVLAFAAERWRKVTLTSIVALAIANVFVAVKLDWRRPDFTTTAQTRSFLLEHTRPGDRLVLGPPFVLAVTGGLEGRETRAVVPQPYFLDPFDADRFVSEINGCCFVYVGDEQWYNTPVWTDAGPHPLFTRATMTRVRFRGQEVLVARRAE